MFSTHTCKKTEFSTLKYRVIRIAQITSYKTDLAQYLRAEIGLL